ncbi:MAG: glycosyltransferase family 4 protein [Candidatus Saccharimonadales bacterium]
MPKTPSVPSLKIGLLLDTSLDPQDGVQQYVIGVGEWLRMQGHDVHYVVGQTTERSLPNIHSMTRNVGVSFNGNRTTIPLFLSKHNARLFLQKEQFDILHVQTPHHPFMAQRLIMAASPTTGVLATFHILPYGLVARLATKILGWLLRPSLQRIDSMLAVSASAAEFEKQTFGLTAQVLPNVIDYPRFNSASPFPKQNGELTILFLGRLVERKGCRVLLEAIVELTHASDAATLPTFKVVICGKGHLDSQLRDYVRRHGLEDRVTFTGFVSEADKPRYYASADIAVFPSSGGESFGIVLLEAMASGSAAVLAGDNPGYRTVMDPKPELLFDPKNVQLLVDKLRELLLDGAKRQTLATWGANYAAQFDVAIVGTKLVNEYNEVLRSRRNMQ